MSPLAILLIALAAVVGGVLVFRLHAFLTLICGALIVAALTPPASIQLQEMRREGAVIEALLPDGSMANVSDRKGLLAEGTSSSVFRVVPGGPPKRIADVEVRVQGGGASRRVTARPIRAVPGEVWAPGDLVVSSASEKAALRSAAVPIGQRVADGFGRTALDVGILIAMASILGGCLMQARGAERIVVSMQRMVGVERTPLAFLASGFLLGIPMFAEAVFYLLLPLAKAMWRRTRKNYLLFVLTIVAGATMTHSLVPPTPGPLFAANELHVELWLMMCQGSIVGGIAALAGFAYALWANRRWPIPLRQSASTASESAGGSETKDAADSSALPPLIPSLLPILLPALLISAAALVESSAPKDFPPWLARAVTVLGDKNLALTLSAGLAIGLLVTRRGMDAAGVRRTIREAIVEGGEIILIIAGGGALGYTLRQAGVAELVGAAVPEGKFALIPVAWAITAVIRIAQGSATVAMITAVGIVAPIALAGNLGYHPVYIAVAIGCGSKIGMWMNDSGFWVVSKMSGLTEAETLKAVSVMVFIEGCVGLVATMALAAAWPMA